MNQKTVKPRPIAPRKLVASLLAVTMVSVSVPALADQPATTVPVPLPPPVISPLKQGQAAPYSGVLFSPPAVAQVIAQQDTAQAALQLAVKHQQDVDTAQQKYALDAANTACTADKTVLQAQLTDAQKQNQILQDQLKKATSGPSAETWIGIGVVGGVVLTVVTAFAYSKATH